MQLGLAHLIDSDLTPLIAESQAFYAQRAARRGPNSWAELKAVRARIVPPAPSSPPAVTELVGSGDRRVRVRVQEPMDRAAAGVYLEIHGGGFYLGSAAASDLDNRRLADALGIAVVSVDYRLAPEHPWPAAPEDCETAALWLAEQAESRFGTTNLTIGGFSAGSTLALATLLRLRDRRVTAFGSAVLQFGTYDLSAQTPAGRLIADEYFLQAYAGSALDRTDPDLSPVYAELSDLPPVLIVVGAEDLLLRDNLALAAQLSAAGVDVDLRVYPASPHAFTGHPTPMARVALDDIDTWLSAQLARTTETG
jgi:acetyl esterase